MAVFTHDCPHCHAGRQAFQVRNTAVMPRDARHWVCFALCPGCNRGLVFEVKDTSPNAAAGNPFEFRGDLADAEKFFNAVGVWPSPAPADIPAHLPERVAKAYREGCAVRSISTSSACAQFRKALEWGLKDLAPGVEAWKLEKRIDKLAAEGKLPDANVSMQALQWRNTRAVLVALGSIDWAAWRGSAWHALG